VLTFMDLKNGSEPSEFRTFLGTPSIITQSLNLLGILL